MASNNFQILWHMLFGHPFEPMFRHLSPRSFFSFKSLKYSAIQILDTRIFNFPKCFQTHEAYNLLFLLTFTFFYYVLLEKKCEFTKNYVV
ncbi:hypothetical protein BpHYR1_047925 [Brachionus plicatilis]|uniref:Uncharacterized protein n=1 Tax=Brachionus plicatilis TaxID=10195 RepID=A0A3M7RKW5_BRAPC|nr:hypothetical protein BpHYR1_047925 [Brachionus plicatilis]